MVNADGPSSVMEGIEVNSEASTLLISIDDPAFSNLQVKLTLAIDQKIVEESAAKTLDIIIDLKA